MRKVRSLILTIGPPRDEPWWWRHIDVDERKCEISFTRISIGNKKTSEMSTLDIPIVFWKTLVILLKSYRRYDYIYTFECDLTTYIISFIQTITFMRRPKHIVLQFIMREKQPSLGSRLKYAFMKFCFLSIHKVVCSATEEAEYYRKTFGWSREKAFYTPLNANPELLDLPHVTEENYIISAGRTFRDYDTLLSAMQHVDTSLVIVASPWNIDKQHLDEKVQFKFDIDEKELWSLLAKSKLVVLTLQDRQISIGQSVLVAAMALGKAVIVTKTNGTIDYVVDGRDSVFVEPYDEAGLVTAIKSLLQDDERRASLGHEAKKVAIENYMPQNYFDSLQSMITEDIKNS